MRVGEGHTGCRAGEKGRRPEEGTSTARHVAVKSKKPGAEDHVQAAGASMIEHGERVADLVLPVGVEGDEVVGVGRSEGESKAGLQGGAAAEVTGWVTTSPPAALAMSPEASVLPSSTHTT